MSSLSQQLKAVADRNATVALDRKTRSKIHSRSLLFDRKTAAAQDYDSIFQIACEGLTELAEFDLRFEVFWNTLFADSSVAFDRNVQSADVLKQLDKNVNAFINLAAPYYLFGSALKALEWLVRRYYINIHNADTLVFSALPYHALPVFTRFMDVVPKEHWPHVLSGIISYKESLKFPPHSSILKVFLSDHVFLRLYSLYLVEQLKNRTVYKEQLVFFISNSVQVLASNARKTQRLNELYIPVFLETLAELFVDRTYRYSATLANDVRLTAYTIVSVLASVAPLTDDVVIALTQSVISGADAFSPSLVKHTLVALAQLWKGHDIASLKNSEDWVPIFAGFPVHAVTDEVVNVLREDNYNIDGLLHALLLDGVRSGNSDLFFALKYLDFSSVAVVDKVMAVSLEFLKSDAALTGTARSHYGLAFQTMLKFHHDHVVLSLESRDTSLAELEMLLMHTLTDEVALETYDADQEHDDVEDAKSLHAVAGDLKATSSTYLNKASWSEFSHLSLALLDTLRGLSQTAQLRKLVKFVATIFEVEEVGVSFLLRLALTPSIPVGVRHAALTCTKQNLALSIQKNQKLNLYLMVPVLLLVLADPSRAVRNAAATIIALIREQSAQLSKQKKVESQLYLENQLFDGVKAGSRPLIAPHDGERLLALLVDDSDILKDAVVDSSRVSHVVFNVLFAPSKKDKKFGPLLVSAFVLGSWAVPSLALVVKERAWNLVATRNSKVGGIEERLTFLEDVKDYLVNRDSLVAEAVASGLKMESLDTSIANLIASSSSKDKKAVEDVEVLIQGLKTGSAFQLAARDRLVAVFSHLKSQELVLRICNELIDLIVLDQDIALQFDPLETLQSLNFSKNAFNSLLSSISLVGQVPEQGIAKRRRRSSASTQKNMAKDEISSMALVHLRKLSLILDVLERQLRNQGALLADQELLQELFKILTDLDYLGNDGKMPVLYAQETLATCMLLVILLMKEASSGAASAMDSNIIRADLIVNSIRLSQSPQVQNRLLLVIAELASLAPEIILHSVMPIFTFMGAQTVRQDDEFSSNALQQTIAKVVPAITAASSSLSNEIEFLLASFITAFQHIPRHRRVKLFVSLIDTLGTANSLHLILFLIGQQYTLNSLNNKASECSSLLDFATALLKIYPAGDCLESFSEFFNLWNILPVQELDKESEDYDVLSKRAAFGNNVVKMTTAELDGLRNGMLDFLHQLMILDDESSLSSNAISLKMKVSLVLFDYQVSQTDKDTLLALFNKLTSFILSTLENLGVLATKNLKIEAAFYKVLGDLMGLLPLNDLISSILSSLLTINDELSCKIAKNFATLVGSKFETEVNANSIDEDVVTNVLNNLLPVLIEGVEKFDDVELVQAYLDSFAVVVAKLGTITKEFNAPSHARSLLNSLKVITSERGLLNQHTEIIVSSLGAISSVVNVLGVKSIAFYPKILPPSLAIWETTAATKNNDNSSSSGEESEDEEVESRTLIQGSILMLFSCLAKRMPAFIISNLKPMISAILKSELIDSSVRSSLMNLIIEHVDLGEVFAALCNLALTENFYADDSAVNLGLYMAAVTASVEVLEKKSAINNSSLFMKWLIKSFSFRTEYGEAQFTDNTVYSIESSIHLCGLAFVMKLNDKSFRPLFASLVRWATVGEGSVSKKDTETTRLIAFYRFFNKLEDNLKSIVTSYYSYLLDSTAALLMKFLSKEIVDINMRRIVLHSLASAFKYDKDDYWTHQLRFDTIADPLFAQLSSIEPLIGKHLVKTISFFVDNVASEEYNEKLVNKFIQYISNETANSSSTKIWTVRALKSVFQKVGDQWLSFLPTLMPYIAELLEDDDEKVEIEVRTDLVRVIEGVLGEPLQRYLE